MTPKQAAARLILKNLANGKPADQLDAAEMTAELGSRISPQKREKILEFVAKILDPFKERMTRISGEASGSAQA